MTPAPVRMIEGWLSELSVIVARRTGDEFSEELRLTAYTSRLMAYPADVVRETLLVRTWKFWPTWMELQEECERLSAPRRHMLAALAKGPDSDDDQRLPPTAEERERAAKVVKDYLEFCRERDAQAKTQDRIRHWSETAAPDDPRFVELRRARAASALCNPRTEQPV